MQDAPGDEETRGRVLIGIEAQGEGPGFNDIDWTSNSAGTSSSSPIF